MSSGVDAASSPLRQSASLSRQEARWGGAVGAACGLLALAGVLGDRLFMPAEDRLQPTDYLWFGALLLYPLMGAVIVHRLPRHRIGRLYLTIGGCITLAPFLEGVSALLGATTAGEVCASLSKMLFGLSWSLITTAAILLFPDGHLPSRRWRPVAGLGVAGTALVTIGALATPAAETAGLLVLGVTTIFSLAAVTVRWRRSDGLLRRQLSWLALAVLVVVSAVAVGVVNHASDGPYAVGVVMESAALAAFPVGTGVAIVRDRLFDIELVLNRSLVYLFLVLVVIGAFVLTVLMAGTAVGNVRSQGAGVVVAAVAVVSLAPLKDRLVRLVDRRLYGERSRPYSVLAGVAARLEGTTEVDELLRTAAAAVAEDLKLPFAEIHPVGAYGGDQAAAEEFPLRHDHRLEGVLVAGLRRGQSSFSQRERALLTDVARHLAVAVRARRLSVEADQSRERIVRAREEERLRIRRDLHDGVGPTLAAARLQVDALSDRLSPDDIEAAQTVARIKEELSHAMADVRRSVEGLRPPALDQVGLSGVVRQRAELLSAAGLEVNVECPDLLETGSAAVEVAAYRIVTEALTNVVRHSGAGRCLVDIDLSGEYLTLTVSDDGIGLNPVRSEGVGLRSMSERAHEVGGTLRLMPGLDGKGTTVVAAIPVPEER